MSEETKSDAQNEARMMAAADEQKGNGAVYDPLPAALGLLKHLPHWVCYEAIPKGKLARPWKTEKEPVNARTGGNAMINTPATWAPYLVALQTFRVGQINGRSIHGLSYALWKGSPEDRLLLPPDRLIIGDLDECRDPETGSIEPWAQKIVDTADTYTEITPSGRGVRFIAAGSLPGPGRTSPLNKHCELYDRGKFLTITGSHLPGTPEKIEERSEQIAAIYQEYFPAKKKTHAKFTGTDSHTAAADLVRATDALQYVSAEDYDQWIRVGMAIHSCNPGEDGFAVWEDWSRTSEKFREGECRKKWKSFHAERVNGVTIASLFDLAIKSGWMNGNGHAARPPEPDFEDITQEADEDDTAENERMTAQEREEDPIALSTPPPVLWQGIFQSVAEKLQLWTWEVWMGIYAALCARAHRNLHFFYHSDHLYGTNNGLLINRTGAGKNIIVNIVRQMLGEDYTIRTGIQSGPALIPLLTDDDLKSKTGRLTVQGRPVVLICSEWSRLVAVAGIEHSTVIEDLNDLHMRHYPWTFARSHKNTSGGDIIVINPALTVVGTTTNKLFHAALTDRMIASGYVNRYLILPGSATFEPYTGRSHRTENLSGIIDHLTTYVWGLGQELGEFYAPAAWEAFLSFQETFILPLQRNPETAETLSRLHLHLQHVAALYAWQEQAGKIELPHFEAARAIIKASHAFVLRLLEERDQTYEPTRVQEVEAAMEKRLIAKLKQTPKRTRRELARDLSHGKGGYSAWAHTIEQLLKAGALFIKMNGKREELHASTGF